MDSAQETWLSGEDIDFNEFNTHIRDNLNETAPGIATTAGRLIVTDGANSVVERIPTEANVQTLETTTSTTFTDLATAGPAVTVTTDTTALVIVTCNISNTSAGALGFMSYAVSGATTVGAATPRALAFLSNAASDQMSASWAHLKTGLTAGSNTFTAKYSVTAGTGSFRFRVISVIPF